MPIATKFQREFDAITRARAEEEPATIERLATKAVQARVTTDSVVLTWADAFGVHCTCGAFQKYSELCPHIWSALIAFDQSTEVTDARTELEAKSLSLKRLTVDQASAAVGDAIDLKAASTWPSAKVAPVGRINFARKSDGFIVATIDYDYDGYRVTPGADTREFLDKQNSRRIKRNLSAEKTLLKSLPKKFDAKTFTFGELKSFVSEHTDFKMSLDEKPIVLLEVSGARLEKHDDHFDFTALLSGSGQAFTLSDVVSGGGGLITLANGSVALVPDEWSKRLDLLSQGATLSKEGGFRFSRTSLPLFKPVFDGIDASPEARTVFDSLARLDESGQAAPPSSLRASLRSYQSEGLFWLQKMSDSGFGGILADDMGLGKTVQIISYLLSRRMHFRARPEEKKPCLVVVPKSLVSNWKNEVEKFGPSLSVLDFAGANRVIFRPQHFDVVLTTYHVLKNEVERLRTVEFDTIILDEAQAIKNPGSQIAKAVFQLQARQRFALSGTPIENSLKDLFSLMHFTNPGLIPPAFDRIYGERKSLALPKSVTERIAASVKPFILRRTKKQVLKELPDKTEQILTCEMDAPQKLLYDRTRKHFKIKLKEQPGVPQQTRVFEALLRLRQIACHPELVNESIESAKVEILLEHLEEIRAAGNKALVFSQFTSFLDLLKPALKKVGIPFEHLDGQTRNRGAVVDRFNSNPDTTVFLISLKAGGTGLNLTTASYVFLMDPWWNPAIESQAIDRAYRMGQKQKVMAYRLIAKGTIEEKILKLQDQKRSLANSLIREDDTFGGSLSMEDLEFLLEE